MAAFGKPAINVFILSGQSNMVGLGVPGELSANYQAPLTNVIIKAGGNPNKGWGDLKPGYGANGNYFGPELGFGFDIHPIFTGEKIAIIKYSVGATTLCGDYRPPSSGGVIGPLYTALTNFTKTAINELSENYDVKVLGMCWMQGESDAVAITNAQAYYTNLTNFIYDVRKDLGLQSLPFIIGMIDEQKIWTHNAIVRQAELDLAQSMTNVFVFDTKGLATDGIHYTTPGQISLGHLFARSAARATSGSYLDNGVMKVGIDLVKGGSITYLSRSGINDNLVNNFDFGRQIQQSYYSGPKPYNPSNNVHAGWTNWPWNPIQTGDAYGHPSQILAHANDGQTLYVKCRPMQWALNNVPGECTLESWISLSNNVITVSNRLINVRSDTTQQFPGFHQELPAVYTIGRLFRLFSYAGNAPFTGGAVTNFPITPPPWLFWRATESWAALLDTNNWGLGIYHPGVVQFGGGFSGMPGSGVPEDHATGYMTPLHREILDRNIEYTFSYQLILGTLTEIRDWVYAQPYRPACDFVFQSDRQHWSYEQTSDTGWPLSNSCVRVSLASRNPQMISPACAFAASAAPKIYIRAAYHLAHPAGRKIAKLFWETSSASGFSKARSLTFPILTDGQFHTYELNLAACKKYAGLITQLRFQPAAGGEPGDYVEVAAISSSPASILSRSLPANPAGITNRPAGADQKRADSLFK